MLLTEIALAAPAPRWFPGGDPLQFPADRFLVGVGQCDGTVAAAARPACARQKANEEIALAIRAKVEAHRERHLSRIVSTGAAGPVAQSNAVFVQQGSATAQVELEDVRAAAQDCGGSDEPCFALAVVDRQAFVQRLQRKYNGIQKVLEQRLLLAATRSARPLARLGASAHVLSTAQNMDELASLMAAVGGVGSAPTAQMTDAISRQSQALNDVEVCLTSAVRDPESDLAMLFEPARATLSQMGVSTISLTSPAECAQLALVIELDGSWERRAVDGLEVADLQGVLSFRWGAATLAGSRPVVGHGVAPNAERALHNAREKLGKLIATAVRETLVRGAGNL